MRTLVTLAVLAVAVAVVAVGWRVTKDSPWYTSREEPPALTATTRLYLDRDYFLKSVPAELAGAVVVRTFRHGPDPVHLNLTEPASIVLLAPAGDPPVAWEGYERLAISVHAPGDATDLRYAYRRSVEAGPFRVDPFGPGRVTSPVIVLGGGDVRVMETGAGLARRVDLATRGFPRRALGIVLVSTLSGLLLLVFWVAGRFGRRR